MPAIVLSSLAVTLNNVDNEILVVVSGRLAVDLSLNNDPNINDTRDLTPLLVPGNNHILIMGINWGGPYHFVGSLHGKDNNGDDVVVGTWNVGPIAGGQGRMATWEFDVIKV